MLNRMVELATQSANGTYDDTTDRYQLQKEMDQLRSEINRIADSANFNGIKLLDGSLSTTGSSADSVKVTGSAIKAMTVSSATRGKYEATDAIAAITASMSVGDKVSYNIGLDDGTSVTVTLTAKADEDGKVTKLVGDSGAEYGITEAKPTAAELGDAFLSEMQQTKLADSFTITQAAGKFTLENIGTGTNVPKVRSMDCKVIMNGKPVTAAGAADDGTVKIGVKTTGPLGDGIELDASKLTEYDGTNYDDAVFTINGKKFVLLTETMDGATTGTNSEYLRAVQALGKDVTVLVGGTSGLTKGDGNFNQNIAKIAEVTGLNVTDAVDESDFGSTDNAVAAGDGIRLSASGASGVSGGLVLQIGDTAESFNQLRVGINDCHTKALGIDKISIANQTDAQSAVDAIKDAINYVSDVRGTLGATQNRLDHTINNLGVMTENIQDAESTIRDVDVAEEMMAYTKNNILIQSAQAMLAQANQVPQGVLQLLQ